MSLKQRLTDALSATPADNRHRIDTLQAALAAGDTEEDIAAAFERLIEAREQKAAQLEKSGQTELAKAERDESARLRALLPSAAEPGAKKIGGALISRNQIVLGTLALVVLVVAVVVILHPFGSGDDSQPQTAVTTQVFKDDHTLGDPNASIKLVEYAAPVCPACAHFNNEEFPALKREFIDTGRVFYIFRVYPIRPQDGAVEGIARCLPKNRYFPYIDMMYHEQAQWDPDGHDIPNPEEAIAKLAARENLSREKAKSCMTDQANLDRINQVAQDAQMRYQIEGTPTFVMDGQVVNFPPTSQTRLDVLRLRINSLSQASGK